MEGPGGEAPLVVDLGGEAPTKFPNKLGGLGGQNPPSEVSKQMVGSGGTASPQILNTFSTQMHYFGDSFTQNDSFWRTFHHKWMILATFSPKMNDLRIFFGLNVILGVKHSHHHILGA